MNFEWKGLPEDDEWVSFRINIDTGYKWGGGWAGEHDNALLYKKEIETVLKEAGFKYYPGNDLGSCATVGKRGDDIYAYLHPMEWTGSGKLECVKELVSQLEKMESVRKIGSLETKKAYNMRPHEISKLLRENISGIMAFIDNEYSPKTYDDEYGIDFCKRFRPNFVSDGGCYVVGTGDQVCEFVRNLSAAYKNFVDMGLISRGDVTKALRKETRDIRIPVPEGEFVVSVAGGEATQACIGFDSKETGYIDLCMAECKGKELLRDNEKKGDIDLYLWGDPFSEDYTVKQTILRDDIKKVKEQCEEEGLGFENDDR